MSGEDEADIPEIEGESLAPRARLYKVERRVDKVEDRLDDAEAQIGRLSSHIESEIGLAREGISRIEKRLFGADESDEYGGRIGGLSRRMHGIELISAAVALSITIIGTLYGLYMIVGHFIK